MVEIQGNYDRSMVKIQGYIRNLWSKYKVVLMIHGRNQNSTESSEI